jgi:hypothetical protein
LQTPKRHPETEPLQQLFARITPELEDYLDEEEQRGYFARLERIKSCRCVQLANTCVQPACSWHAAGMQLACHLSAARMPLAIIASCMLCARLGSAAGQQLRFVCSLGGFATPGKARQPLGRKLRPCPPPGSLCTHGVADGYPARPPRCPAVQHPCPTIPPPSLALAGTVAAAAGPAAATSARRCSAHRR